MRKMYTFIAPLLAAAMLAGCSAADESDRCQTIQDRLVACHGGSSIPSGTQCPQSLLARDAELLGLSCDELDSALAEAKADSWWVWGGCDDGYHRCQLVMCCPDTPVPPPGMLGTFEGRAREIVAWSEQEWIDIQLTVAADGTVTGTFGDATMHSGTVERNSEALIWIGNSEYFIEADLQGAIVESEQIHRESVRLLVDMVDDGDSLEGGFHTSGNKVGGKDSMIMSGVDLVLRRIGS